MKKSVLVFIFSVFSFGCSEKKVDMDLLQKELERPTELDATYFKKSKIKWKKKDNKISVFVGKKYCTSLHLSFSSVEPFELNSMTCLVTQSSQDELKSKVYELHSKLNPFKKSGNLKETKSSPMDENPLILWVLKDPFADVPFKFEGVYFPKKKFGRTSISINYGRCKVDHLLCGVLNGPNGVGKKYLNSFD